jgi:UDP-N-acetylglucosamine 2-epimerase (non-hydrolysing)
MSKKIFTMKIVTVVGARPQFIKAALITESIEKSKRLKPRIMEVLVNTGQHYDYNMSKKFFEELNIKMPDYELNINSPSSLNQLTRMIHKLKLVFKKEKPEFVMVYGDTNTTLAGALAANKLHIPICHIEAGLRSYDKSMPEEINRLLTDHISSLLFCPTMGAVRNLRKENIKTGIHLVGDIMYELSAKVIKLASSKSKILDVLGLKSRKYILATVHRESNTDVKSKLQSIIRAFGCIENDIVFPVHPRTRKMLIKYGLMDGLARARNVKVVEPLGYMNMICLEKNACKIITDSGGIQKESYFFKVPCLTLRDNTEWSETLNNRWNILVGTDPERIIAEAHNNKSPGRYVNYYGDGNTSTKIIEVLKGMV